MPDFPSDAEVEAAAKILDAAGRFHGWWPKDLAKYEDLEATDPIAKSEFDGLVQQMLMAAEAAKPIPPAEHAEESFDD